MRRAIWRYVISVPVLLVLAFVEGIGAAAGELGGLISMWVANGEP